MSPRLKQPVFIISPPRSGSTLRYNVLCGSPWAWSMDGEGHLLVETIPGLHPRERKWTSNRLTEQDAQPNIVAELTRRYLAKASNREGRRPAPGEEPTRPSPE